MPNRALAKAYKDWLQAVETMRAALTANPLVADPLMASAQVFEDVGTMLFEAIEKPRAKRAKPRKKARARARKK